MALMRHLLIGAARRIASNPKVRRAASETLDQKVKPRMQNATRNARGDYSDIARDINPREEPARFAGRLTRRLIDRVRE